MSNPRPNLTAGSKAVKLTTETTEEGFLASLKEFFGIATESIQKETYLSQADLSRVTGEKVTNVSALGDFGRQDSPSFNVDNDGAELLPEYDDTVDADDQDLSSSIQRMTQHDGAFDYNLYAAGTPPEDTPESYDHDAVKPAAPALMPMAA